MPDLGPQYQNLSYQGLLQVPGGITASLQQVQDGDGNGTGLYLSSSSVGIAGFVATTTANIAGGTAGSIPYQTAPDTTGFIAPSFSGYVLVSNGASAPSWSNTAPHALTSNATTNLAGGAAGSIPYQSSAGVTSYVSPGSASQILISNGSGAPLWATFVAASVGALAIDGSNAMAANLNAGNYRVTNVATPSSATDAATKGYVDSVATGLNIKAACTVATTGNITLSGIQSVDGVPVGAGQRVLVKNQTNTAENGIYDSASGAWARSSDANTWSELVGATVFIEYGSVNDATTWTCNVAAGGTLGTTPVTFVQFGAAQTYTAGYGLTLVGNQFSLTTPVVANFAAALQTARTINGVPFDGTTNITIPSTSTYSVTFNDTGSGAASGVTYNGSTAQTISYNTIGAPSSSGANVTAGSTWPINISGNASSINNSSGVTPGTYSNATVTVNAQGLVTSASAGSGSSTYVVVSGFTTAAINAAIATAGAGGTIFLPAGTYSITSTITLNDINVIGSGYSTILQGSTASLGSANPMFVLTGIVTIKSLLAQFDVKPVSASSGQYVIFRTGNGSNPLQRYSNIDSVFTRDCGTAFYNPSGGGSVFSTTFSNLRVEFFTYRGFDFNGTDRTGNVYSNLYIAAGIPSAGVLNTCNCLFALSGFESECTIQQLNLEHSIFTQACAIFNGIGAISCSTLHVEQVKPASNNIPYIYTNGSSGTFTAFTFLGNWYPAYSMPTTTGNSIFQMNSCLSTYSSPSPTTANYFNIGEFYIANSATTLGWNMFARGTNDGPMYVEIGGYQYTPSDNYYANFPTSGNIEFISSGVNASFNQPVRKINGQTTFKNDGLTIANAGATTVFERPTNGSLMQMYIGGVASGQLYTTSGGTPALFSGSDYRLKENIQPIADASDKMKLVQAYTYNMIGNDALHQGFLAHELQQVCDHAVIGEKDAFDKDGKPIYQQVATTMLIPLMAQAVKEILVRLDALESKINSMQQ